MKEVTRGLGSQRGLVEGSERDAFRRALDLTRTRVTTENRARTRTHTWRSVWPARPPRTPLFRTSRDRTPSSSANPDNSSTSNRLSRRRRANLETLYTLHPTTHTHTSDSSIGSRREARARGRLWCQRPRRRRGSRAPCARDAPPRSCTKRVTFPSFLLWDTPRVCVLKKNAPRVLR